MDPFHKTVMIRLTVISIVNPQKFNAASMGGTVNLISFALLTAIISLSHLFYFIESHENTIVEFLFSYLSKWECKIYMWYALIHCSSSQPNYDDVRY